MPSPLDQPQIVHPPETESSDHFQKVRLERYDLRGNVETAQDIQRLLAENDQRRDAIVGSILSSFQGLPESYRKQVVASLPEHWTGDQYPLYDSLRTAAA